MTGKSSSEPRTSLVPALLLAALAMLLLGGCFASRAPVPTQDQRITEAEGRKARQEREAAEAAAAPAATTEAAKPVVKKESQPAPVHPAPIQAAPVQTEAKPEAKTEAKAEAKVEPKPETPAPAAAPAPAPAMADKAAPAQSGKAEAAPTLSAEQLPAKELTLQGQYVQIASFGTEKNAQNAVAWLSANGYATSRVVRVEQGGNVLHRVQAGPFQDPAAARGALDALKAQWPQAFIPAD